ncbi:MAG: right-handed parallel beta-helix repeat-containing protein [Sneathiella sp.]
MATLDYIIKFLTFLALVTPVTIATSKEIYVDFEDGSNSNKGFSETEAWKHAPGDPAGFGNPSRYTLQPGDVVLFKGGAEYLGSIILNGDGDPSKPITYKGNGWGEEKAIMSGSKTVNVAFEKCVSSADCFDNDNWEKLYKSNLAEKINPLSPVVIGGERQWLAQTPNQTDPFWFDDITQYLPLDPTDSDVSLTNRSLMLNEQDITLAPEDWKSAYIAIWMQPNTVVIQNVTDVKPETNTIFFQSVENKPYTDREFFFSVFNRSSDIDRSGEFAIVDDVILLWPSNLEILKSIVISVNERAVGFDLRGKSNIVIEGFEIRQYYGGSEGWKSGAAIFNSTKTSENITISENNISDLKSVEGVGAIQLHHMKNVLVKNNIVSKNQKNSGIRLAYSEDAIIRDNIINRIGRTGIRLIDTKNVEVSGNQLSDIRGGHGNGMSVYLKNLNTLIASNIVIDTPSAFTFHGTGNPSEAKNLWLLNNVFLGRVNSWGRNYSSVVILHNLFFDPNARGKSLQIPGKETDVVLVNNIIDGLLVKPPQSDWIMSGNVYTELGWTQSRQYGWILEPGGLIEKGLAESILQFGTIMPADSLPKGAYIGDQLPINKFKEFDFTKWGETTTVGPSLKPVK